jgi:hypothetical protein
MAATSYLSFAHVPAAPRVASVPAICLLLLLLTSAAAGPARAALDPVFTYPPTDIANVAGVVPLGNLNPGGGHVLPVNHMYLRYADQVLDGTAVYPVRAMAAGRIVMAILMTGGDTPPRYQLYIRHSLHVTSYVIYLYTLSDRIRTHLESTGTGWFDVGGAEFRIMIMGRLGAPERLTVEAGEVLGTTANYHQMWDVGVIDDRVPGSFVGRGPRRYPRFGDLFALLGYDPYNPVPGQHTVNATSFIRYLSPEHKAAWFDLLDSEPKRHGRTGWDVAGRLRGVWFNPAVDTASPPPLFDLESAVVSIVPYNLAPATRTQIGIASGGPLSLIDPTRSYPQLKNRFVVDTDKTPGARVNPDPAAVGPATGTVCYDLAYSAGTSVWNTLQVHLLGKRRVAFKFDPIPLSAPGCAGKTSGEPDATWAVYRR